MPKPKIPVELRREHKRQYDREYYQRMKLKEFRQMLKNLPVPPLPSPDEGADTNTTTEMKKGELQA